MIVVGGSVEAYGRVGNGDITTTISLFLLPDSTPSATKDDDPSQLAEEDANRR